jgi:hypothetical protein
MMFSHVHPLQSAQRAVNDLSGGACSVPYNILANQTTIASSFRNGKKSNHKSLEKYEVLYVGGCFLYPSIQ